MKTIKTELLKNIDYNLKSYNPLVSIVVVTYNSAKFVIKTLESVKSQTFKNIELILSDDCSTDNTVEICKIWIECNNHHFVNIILIEADFNTGTPSNCNRGVNVAKGEWVKLIAGDDLLLENCIKDNVDFTRKIPTAKIIFSNSITINSRGKKIGEIYQNSSILNKENSIQFKKLLKYYFLSTTGAFLNRELIKSVGGFDENYRLMEDYPFFLKLSKNGIRFFYLNKFTVKYRIYSESVMNNKDRQSKSVIFFREDTRKIYVIIFKELLRKRLYYIYTLRIIEFYLRKISLKIQNPKLLKYPLYVVFKLLTK